MPNLEREIECDVHGIEHSCVLPNHTVSNWERMRPCSEVESRLSESCGLDFRTDLPNLA